MTDRRALYLVFIAVCLGVASACTTTFTSPTSPKPDGPEGSFSAQLTPQGSASRAFTVRSRGTVSITLTTTTPPGTRVGLGVGIPRGNLTGCSLTQSVATVAGAAPQLTVTADAGDYCAQVFDLGTLTDPIGFTILLSYP